MSKTLQVAVREFVSTVSTKGFVIGTLVFPALMIAAIMVIPKLLTNESPTYVGKVAVLDRSGWVGEDERTLTDLFRHATSKEGRAEKKAREDERARQIAGAKAREFGGEQAGQMAEDMTDQATEQIPGDESEVEIVVLPADIDLEAEKDRLWEGSAFEGGLLALIVIDEHAVTPALLDPSPPDDSDSDEAAIEQETTDDVEPKDLASGDTVSEEKVSPILVYGAYESFVRAKLDDRFQNPLKSDLHDVIRQARFAAAGYDRDRVEAIRQVSPPKTVEVTAEGERGRAGSDTNILVAMGFMMLLWISVMSGGQYLMTTVITEKSNRVMEVLLSAVSPKQLMTGKILGQMCVALSILGVYLTIGLVALDQFNLLYLIEKSDLALMAIYFFLAFFFLATAMAAIGSAVTEIMEANALFTPVVMVLIIPWLLFVPLSQNPNSMFATIIGMIPPISPFAMVIREAGTDPIPVWQHVVAIGVGIIAVYGAIWATAKIFRIGVLMYGKPPNLRTLVKWVWMA